MIKFNILLIKYNKNQLMKIISVWNDKDKYDGSLSSFYFRQDSQGV